MRIRFVGVLFGALSVLGAVAPHAMAFDLGDPAPSAIIVKYRSDGPHALDRCAEGLSRSGEAFSTATRDASDSLDRLQREFGLGPHRAWMGAPDRESLTQRRERLATRFAKLRQKSRRARAAQSSGRRRLPPPPDPSTSRMAQLAHVYRVEVGPGRSAEDAAAALAADPHVEYAMPDHLDSLDQLGVPFFDDPFLASSGSWGQPHPDLWGPERIGAPAVWPRTQGEGIVVAVVDTGLDRFHPDIAANVWVNPGEDLDGDGIAEPEDENGIDDDGNGFIDDLTGFDFANSIDADEDGFYDGPDDVSDADPFDDRGHGTHVAGTIAAVAGNGRGIVGIAPRARVMAVKGFRATGSGEDSLLWRGVLYAAMNGADIINNSWSCGTPCPENPLAEDVLEIVVGQLGVVVVTSAGNATEDVLFRSPENGRRVVTVGSLAFDDTLSDFSNRGWLLDIVAPGGGPNTPRTIFLARRNILSLLSSGTVETERAFAVGDDYYRLAGTSMSSPHVAGAVALLLSLRPDLDPADVRRLIRMSARDRGEIGRDPVFGSGLLDVAALVDEPLPDLVFDLDAPGPGTTHDPADGDLFVRGRIAGRDVASVEIDIGAGLSPRVFAPIESLGDSRILWMPGQEVGLPLARWDLSGVAEGTYTIRVRARLVDGRIAEEITIVGIERNRPALISSGVAEASAPVISRRQVFWPQIEATPGSFARDLFSGRFPSKRHRDDTRMAVPVPVVEGEGDQRSVVLSGRELAWITATEKGNRLERCRWDPRRRRCDVEIVVEGDGAPSRAWMGGRWLVWTRTSGGRETIEGCRIDSGGRRKRVGQCRPRPLLDPTALPGWRLESFDGESLLLKRGPSTHALCRLGSKADHCTPDPFEFVSSSFLSPFDPIHQGNLVAFSDVGTRLVFPPGCEPGVFTEGCLPSSVFSLRFHACWIDEADRRCEAIPISETVPFEEAHGIAISGRRIVWSMGTSIERPAIHFCEFDREDNECIDQRITGHPAGARSPAIDGPRLVWEDARLGPDAIWGFELPDLHVPPSWWVRAGRRFILPVFGSPGSAEDLHYSIEMSGVNGTESLDVRFVPMRRRRRPGGGDRRIERTFRPAWGWLVGELPDDSPATARWRVRATTNGGLFSSRVVDVEVRSRRGRRGHRASRKPASLDSSTERPDRASPRRPALENESGDPRERRRDGAGARR